ncbi:MAG: hypothetical protein MJB14_08675 [Spirochaetes bacterium]|nr:hypothetical protein [Spirochaetota bacterium]
MEKILEKICQQREILIQKKGYHFGIELSDQRTAPLCPPQLDQSLIICEIKRGSPSEGKMDTISDPVSLANTYLKNGATAISILTEENFFYGSLRDIINVKNAFPHSTILRKDFIQYKEELDVTFRAGADMVLLITAMFMDQKSKLHEFNQYAQELGLTPLLEVHNEEELNLALEISPVVLGINSRNLKTFQIDKNYPLALKSMIKSRPVIFESGIKTTYDAVYCGAANFNGVLVGTSIVKSQKTSEKIRNIAQGFKKGKKQPYTFFTQLFKKIYLENKLMVKICGITNLEDAKIAIEAGADLIGFIFAESPRKISVKKARSIVENIDPSIPKIAVVTDPLSSELPDIIQGIKDGWLAAIQFHGNIAENLIAAIDIPYYRALNPQKKEDLDQTYNAPFVLLDAFVKGQVGGTGKLLKPEIVRYAKQKFPCLYLAGGINPENVEEIINQYQPNFIDLSSGVEKAPGKKDKAKVQLLFKNIKKLKG